MSLLDDVSILVTPNGFKGGTLHSAIPSDGSADMDVTRATAGTRVDENGLVNYAEVLGSEEVTNGDFDTDSDWAKLNGSTISGGVGNVIAGGSIGNSDANFSLTQNSVFDANKTYKVKFKARKMSGNGNLQVGRDYIAFFDQTITSSFVEYEITFFTNPIGIFSGGLVFGGRVSGDVFEIDNVSVKEVDLNNVPRIDYTGGGCPHILAEPQRTNSLFQSNQFDTTWVLTNSSVVGNQSGIYNTTDAWKLVGNGANNDRLNSNSLSSGAYTFSIYAKAGNSKFTAVVLGSAVVYYNLETGSVGSAANVTNSSIESVGNDWYRLTLSVASFTGSAQIYIANGVGNVNTSNGDFIYLQHAQAEVGSYATSIIPTSTSTVTRNKDVFTRDGISSLINSTEGVLFVEIAALSDDGTYRLISISDGTNNNRVTLGFSNNNNKFYFQLKASSNNIFAEQITETHLDSNKIAFKYKSGELCVYINGVKVIDRTDSFTFNSNLNDLILFEQGTVNPFFGKVKQLQVYKTALTDTQLTSLTS